MPENQEEFKPVDQAAPAEPIKENEPLEPTPATEVAPLADYPENAKPKGAATIVEMDEGPDEFAHQENA